MPTIWILITRSPGNSIKKSLLSISAISIYSLQNLFVDEDAFRVFIGVTLEKNPSELPFRGILVLYGRLSMST